jgi:hypothetical protein
MNAPARIDADADHHSEPTVSGKPDVLVTRDAGSMSGVYRVFPLTPAADVWVDEHIPEDATWLGTSLIVEHGYIGDIVTGMSGDGLNVKCGEA